MAFEYKCVAAPERAKRKRGARSRTERVARAMEEIIAAEAVDGWEYQRTDLIPVEEKTGLFSRAHEVHRAVLVFRRSLGQTQPSRPAAGQAPMAPPLSTEPEEEPIRLAAERDDRSHASAPQSEPSPRAPTGLG